MKKLTLVAALALLGSLVFSAPEASATSIVNWDLTAVNDGNLCQNGGPCSSGGYDTASKSTLNGVAGGFGAVRGNTLSFLSDGGSHELVAAALSTTGAGDTFETSFLGNYPLGLGVINENDGYHTVDNANDIDMVVFRFPGDNWDPVSADLASFGDTDATILIGGTEAAFRVGDDLFAGFENQTFAGLAAAGFAVHDDLGGSLSRTIFFPPDDGTTAGRYLIIAARVGGLSESGFCFHSCGTDKFKVGAVAATPEPSSVLLFGVGGTLVGAAIRRKSVKNA
jgi:hypothetical protein